MRKLVALGTAIVALAVPLGAFADSTGNHGQPSQSCQAQTSTPGNAANAPGSPFNPAGHAGTVYAGTGENTETPANGHAVSQYDVACFQVSH